MSAVTWGHEPLVQVGGPWMPRTAMRAAGRGVGRPAEPVVAHDAEQVVAHAAGLIVGRPQVGGRPTPPVAVSRAGQVVARPAGQVGAPQARRVAGAAPRDAARTAGPRARPRAAGAGAATQRAGAAHANRAAVSTRTAPSMHLTARGRVTVVALSAGLALWGALSAPSAVADRPGEARAVVTHTVAPGESLWRVAQSIAAPREDVRDVVDELIVLNGLANGELRAGQQILVPAR